MIYKKTTTNNIKGFTSNLNFQKKENSMRGFTLIETMVAVFIMAISITSLITVVTSSLFAAKYTRDKITATYLLQEAVDYIRNDRDTSVFLQRTETTEEAWSSFKLKYNNCTANTNSTCYLDVLKAAGQALPNCNMDGTDCNLLYDKDTDGSFYNYETGVKTGFKRQIIVTIPNPDEMNVEVIVSWKNGELTKSMSLKTSLLNW